MSISAGSIFFQTHPNQESIKFILSGPNTHYYSVYTFSFDVRAI